MVDCVGSRPHSNVGWDQGGRLPVARTAWREFLCWYKLADLFLHLPGCSMSNRGRSRAGACALNSWRRLLRGADRGAGLRSQAEPERCGTSEPPAARIPNEPERGGIRTTPNGAGDPKEPERHRKPKQAGLGGSRRVRLPTRLHERTQAGRDPNEPEWRRRSERTRAPSQTKASRARRHPASSTSNRVTRTNPSGRDPNEPEPCARQTNPSAAEVPGETVTAEVIDVRVARLRPRRRAAQSR
jgi:hypothetical protein